MYSSISSSVAVALPSFPTTTPAARFANSIELSTSIPFAKQYPKEAITVSPAPVTSYTSLATVGFFMILLSLLSIAIPSSLKVIIGTSKDASFLNFFKAFSKLASSTISTPVAIFASFLFGVRRYAPLYLE